MTTGGSRGGGRGTAQPPPPSCYRQVQGHNQNIHFYKHAFIKQVHIFSLVVDFMSGKRKKFI